MIDFENEGYRIERIIQQQILENEEKQFLESRGTSHQPFMFSPYEHFININQVVSPFTGKIVKSDLEAAMAIANFFSSALKGEKLIDLGSGYLGSIEVVTQFAARGGVDKYIGVDPYCHDYEESRLQVLERRAKGLAERLSRDSKWKDFVNPTLKVGCVNEDMLRFLYKQPDNSANICLNGVDFAIVNNDEYISELQKQIARVTRKKGFAFGFNSPHLLGLKNYGFERVLEIPGYRLLAGSEKKEFKRIADHSELVFRKI